MNENNISCKLTILDYSQVQIIEIEAELPLTDYLQAMQVAAARADKVPGEHVLISWYDRDRDFKSPQHSSECHQDAAIPGYVDYLVYG